MKQTLASNLLENPVGGKLFLLNKVFTQMIPFNSPHKVKILFLSRNKVKTFIPYRRSNFNHLNGIHACATSALGEFAAGLLVLKNFNLMNYRIILKELNTEYSYQGRTDLFGEITIEDNFFKNTKEELEKNTRTEIEVKTKVLDVNNHLIATVRSLWQLKDWKKVKTK